MRTLTNDPDGTADWLDREAAGLDPHQLDREFVQNGIEAGATKITIDGWTDPDTGHVLARITDNGTGMTHQQLVTYLSTLHVRSKGKDNHGVGARIAALPFNRGGVTFASRSADGDAMVTLHRHRGRYGIKEWTVLDADGDETTVEIIHPAPGMLTRLKSGDTGTAVILHGDGQSDTWTPTVAYQTHKFLSGRYYDWARDDVQVRVNYDGASKDYRSGSSAVTPLGQYLAKWGTADGEIPFTNVAGMSGNMFWWVLPPQGDIKSQTNRVAHTGGVGLVVDNEVFNYARAYSGDFGVIYKSIQNRVAILIWVDQASMDTGRGGVVLPGQDKTGIPWKQFGAHFAEHMPDEIEELLSGVTVASAAFDADLAKMLDEDWMKRLQPVKVNTPGQDGPPATGDQAGDNVPAHTSPQRQPTPSPAKPVKPVKPPQHDQSGDQPGSAKAKVVTPRVQFLSETEGQGELFDLEQFPMRIGYIGGGNVVQISTEFAPYKRELDRWMEKTNHTRQVVEQAVQQAYQVEYAATIIDANAQVKHKLPPEHVESLKSSAALYAKALGMQALTERIADFITKVAKSA